MEGVVYIVTSIFLGWSFIGRAKKGSIPRWLAILGLLLSLGILVLGLVDSTTWLLGANA